VVPAASTKAKPEVKLGEAVKSKPKKTAGKKKQKQV
jgi:membrane-bound lytic murein transglycosylase B